MPADGGFAGPATALVVGVTSHRDLRSEDLPGLRQVVADALGSLRAQFPLLQLVILSPLAEGGDRLVAQVGLDLGARLIVPLPLPPDDYHLDFNGVASRDEFQRLVGQADSVLLAQSAGDPAALSQPGPARDRQYLQAGLYVANHCHVLVALWDGHEDGGTGGTAQIVRYYLGGPLPGARRATDNLRQMLAGDDDSLVLHLPVHRDSRAQAAEGVEPAWLTSAARRPLHDGLPPEYAMIFARMQTYESDRRRICAELGAEPAMGDALARLLLETDAMALRQQRRMLGAMRAIHGLAVLMGMAFLLYSDLGAPDWLLWVFLVFFASGLSIAWLARRNDWHRKYVDYRALAEGLRVQWFWRRAGLSVTGDPEFAHDNFLQKQDIELGWIRNVMRQVGVMASPANGDADACMEEVIEDWVGRPGVSGQLDYYQRKAELRARHHLRTEALGRACLWTGIGISLFLALFHRGLDVMGRDLLVTTMGTLSLLAAVREAYSYRKADKELVKQYRFMHRIYRNARAALDAAASIQERREILRALGEAALAEHAEWALMHRDRPIEHGRP